MANTIYDEHADFFVDFVDAQLADPNGLAGTLVRRLDTLLGERVKSARVCDLACGEGYLSRHLASRGANLVRGVDISQELIAVAQKRGVRGNVSFQVDDVQTLGSFPDATFDLAVSQMAIMDIADHRAMFRAARRVLIGGGTFAFSMLHPCFQSPFRLPDEPPFPPGPDGQPFARIVRRYASEGRWESGGTGVRGRMGAYHRRLSTIVNDVLGAGFQLEALDEPVLPNSGLWAEVPTALIVVASAP